MAASAISLQFAFFCFNDTATTEIYTLSLHDALPILPLPTSPSSRRCMGWAHPRSSRISDRKSTRLNSSHGSISYAVFCLKQQKCIERDKPCPPAGKQCPFHSRLCLS